MVSETNNQQQNNSSNTFAGASLVLPEFSEKEKDQRKKRLLFDHKMEYHNQYFLAQQIIKYLQKEVKNRQKDINYFEQSKGECVGLSVLWAYGKRIEDESFIPFSDVKDTNTFFNAVYRKLILWDGQAEFTKTDQADIEWFIANLIFYQEKAQSFFKEVKANFDEPLYFKNTKRGEPFEVFKQRIGVDEAMLASRLSFFVKPKTMVFLAAQQDGAAHAMAIYQNSRTNKIYFYDANERGGEQVVETFEELAKAIFKSSDPARFAQNREAVSLDSCDNLIRYIKIALYQLPGDPVYTYPTKSEFGTTEDELNRLTSGSCFLKNDIMFAYRMVIPLVVFLPSENTLKLLQNNNSIASTVKQIMVSICLLNSDQRPSHELIEFIKINYKDFVVELYKSRGAKEALDKLGLGASFQNK